MKRRLKETQELERKRKERGESQISLTDPDSRSMPLGGGRTTVVGYNVHFSVDPKHKLILDHQVTNSVTDRDLLSDMAKRAKEILGVDQLEALADMGYFHGKEVKACLEAGITPYIPRPQTFASRKRGLFAKNDFNYDPEQDCYWCPAGESLTFRFPWPSPPGQANNRKEAGHQVLCHSRLRPLYHSTSMYEQQGPSSHYPLGG